MYGWELAAGIHDAITEGETDEQRIIHGCIRQEEKVEAEPGIAESTDSDAAG
jgi:hypothetical protein